MQDTARIGLSFFGTPARELLDLAPLVEELGYSRISLGDHAVSPVDPRSRHPNKPAELQQSPVVPPRTDLVDPMLTLAALAGVTEQVGLATGVTIGPLYHPLLLARAAANLQAIAQGRFWLGLGVGWLAEEYAALGRDFARRGAILDEMLTVLRLAWKGEPFSFEGEHFRFDALTVVGTPCEVPLIIGGTTERALLRAADHGDAYYCPSEIGLDVFLGFKQTIERRREENGRADRPFTWFARLPAVDARLVEHYLEAGITELTVPIQRGPGGFFAGASTPEQRRERLRERAEEFGITPRPLRAAVDPVTRLIEMEEIRQLKARYFRCVDSQDWTGFRQLFTDDAVCRSDLGENPIDRLVHILSARLPGTTTVHHGHMPEIELLAPDRARGVWAMADVIRRPHGSPEASFNAYGHYHEEYVKEGGAWKIRRLDLVRLLKEGVRL